MRACVKREHKFGVSCPLSHREGTGSSLWGSQAVTLVALGGSGVQLVSFWSPLVSAISLGGLSWETAAHPSVLLAGPWDLSDTF